MEPNKPLWTRQPGESIQAFEAARAYFELGVIRSLAAVGQKLGKSKVLMERWSRRWDWVNRAVTFDRRQDQKRQERLLRLQREQDLRWLEIDEKLRQDKYDMAMKHLAKQDKMLDFPLATITTETLEENGTVVRRTTVRPGKWSFDTASRMAERAFKWAHAAIRNQGTIRDKDSALRDVDFNIIPFEETGKPEPTT